MKRYFLLVVLATAPALLFGAEASAQTASLSGVVQTSDALPVAGATVRLEGTAFGALTDTRGHFRIGGLSAGTYTVIAEQLGYTMQAQTVALTDSLTLRFVLQQSPVALSGVVVTASGTAERQLTATTAIGAVTGPELRELKASHPAEVLSRVAGAWVNVAGSGEGHLTSIRQPLTTNPVYLYLEDGLPTRSTGFFNHNALYEINVPQAGRVEVLKGPGTALHGSDAIGGVINVETRAPSLDNTAEFFAEAGGHGWNRLLASLSGSRDAAGLRLDVNYTKWGGWRDESGYDRQGVTLRWDQQLARGASLKTVFAYSDIDQIDPSPLTRPVFESDAEVNNYPIANRAIRAFRLSSSFTAARGATELTLTPFVRSNDMDIVPFWMLTFDPVTYQTGHKSAGMVARVQRELPALRGSITAGADFDYSPGFREEYQINVVQDGNVYASFERGNLIYDYDVTFKGASPYMQVVTQPFERLQIDAGLRYDHISYDYDNRLEPLASGPHRRPDDATVTFTQLSPKFGVSYDLGQAALFGSYRHSFRAPSEGQLFRQGGAANTIDLDPIRARSVELGARAAFHAFDFEITGYDMRVFDDVLTFITETNQREATNAGETRHFGLELAAGWTAAPWLRLDVSGAHARHEYQSWQPRANLSYAGHEMAMAPRNLVNVRARFSPSFLGGGAISADYQRVGSYWEDPENTSKYEGHELVNMRARVPLRGGVDVIVRATNIFDERYAEQATYTAFDLERLQPGAPRMLYIGIQGRWPEIKP